jgi:hypothetical protein
VSAAGSKPFRPHSWSVLRTPWNGAGARFDISRGAVDIVTEGTREYLDEYRPGMARDTSRRAPLERLGIPTSHSTGGDGPGSRAR